MLKIIELSCRNNNLSIAIPFLFINIWISNGKYLFNNDYKHNNIPDNSNFCSNRNRKQSTKRHKKKKEKQNSRTCDLRNIHSYIYSYYLPWYQQDTVRTLSDLFQKKQYQLSYHFLF